MRMHSLRHKATHEHASDRYNEVTVAIVFIISITITITITIIRFAYAPGSNAHPQSETCPERLSAMHYYYPFMQFNFNNSTARL